MTFAVEKPSFVNTRPPSVAAVSRPRVLRTSATLNFSSEKLRRCAFSDGVALSGIMKISISGASSLSLSISVFF